MTVLTEDVVAHAIARSLVQLVGEVDDLIGTVDDEFVAGIESAIYGEDETHGANTVTLLGWDVDEAEQVEFLVTVTRVEVESS